MQTINECDQQLAEYQRQRIDLVAQIESAQHRLDRGDQSAALQIVALKEQVFSIARNEEGLELDRPRIQREIDLAECERIGRALRQKLKGREKLSSAAADSLAACNEAFDALAKHNADVDALTERYNRVALSVGKEPELSADPVNRTLDNAIAGQLAVAYQLAVRKDMLSRVKLGAVETVKLILASLFKGVVLTPDGQDYAERKIRYIENQFAQQDFAKAKQFAESALSESTKVYNQFYTGDPNPSPSMSQEEINRVSKIAQQHAQKRQYPDGLPEPQAPDEETTERHRQYSTPLKWGPWGQ